MSQAPATATVVVAPAPPLSGEYHEVLGQLLTQGYHLGTPHRLSHAARQIDAAACAESKCPECGHKGCTYEPLHRPSTGQYRPLCVCPACLHAEEF